IQVLSAEDCFHSDPIPAFFRHSCLRNSRWSKSHHRLWRQTEVAPAATPFSCAASGMARFFLAVVAPRSPRCYLPQPRASMPPFAKLVVASCITVVRNGHQNGHQTSTCEQGRAVEELA